MDTYKAKQFLLRSLDGNAITTAVGDSLNINPTVWNRQLRDFQRENLVVTQFAQYQDFTEPGSELIITIHENPGVAAALTETVDVGISDLVTRQVTHEPTEYGKAYQVTKKELRRGFFNIVENAIMKLSFATALLKERNALTVLYAGAGSTVRVNGKATSADLTSDDKMDLATILVARQRIVKNLYAPNALFVTPEAEGQLLNVPGIQRANEFGGTEAIRRGFVGTLFGINIIMSDNLSYAESDAVSRNIMIGTTKTGEACFGHGVKSLVALEREYHARGRYWDLVADEDYDFLMYHPDAAVIIESHNAGFLAESSS